MAIRINSYDGPIGVLVDLLTEHEQNAEHEPELRKFQEAYDGAVEAVKEARKSEELTELGKTAAVKRHVRRGLNALDPYREELERLEGAISRARSKALERPAGERDPEAIAMEREIRDRLMEEGAHELDVGARYLTALRTGDHAFARAVENAPAAYALIDAETRKQGQEFRIKQSDKADEIEALEAKRSLFSQMVNTTETELKNLAERNGVDPFALGEEDQEVA